MRDKNLIATCVISFLVFTFLILLVYIIYCYAFYDRYTENGYIDKYNNGEYEFVYNHCLKENLNFNDFMTPINIMYDKTKLTKIYNTYYSKYDMSLDEFIDTYYFGNRLINNESVSFIISGKTTLTKRADIKYEKIELINKTGHKSIVGIIKNVILEINDNSYLSIDNKELTCIDNECYIEYIFGGIHEIKYQNNNITYYGLININKSDNKMDVNLTENLVNIHST